MVFSVHFIRVFYYYLAHDINSKFVLFVQDLQLPEWQLVAKVVTNLIDDKKFKIQLDVLPATMQEQELKNTTDVCIILHSIKMLVVNVREIVIDMPKYVITSIKNLILSYLTFTCILA